MRTINVNPTTKQQNSVIHIDNGSLGRINLIYDFSQHSSVLIVTDDIVEPLLLNKLKMATAVDVNSVVVQRGEKYKNIESIQKIWATMQSAGCDRKSLVINLGGGVIGDIGGFAASTYMRGVSFLNIPTTLLAQVDASVGGKNGVNFGGIKNFVGTFNQPICTIIDPEILSTLPDREFVSGFGEIIKQGLIYDAEYYNKVISKNPRDFSTDELAEIIATSCQIKAEVVRGDVNESGKRKILNFGHTIGHAVESLSLETDAPLLHGEAVSIGMVAEAYLSSCLGLLTFVDSEKIKQSLINSGLPARVSGLQSSDVLEKMQSDKKNTNGQVNFTLLNGIGSAIFDQKIKQSDVIGSLEKILM